MLLKEFSVSYYSLKGCYELISGRLKTFDEYNPFEKGFGITDLSVNHTVTLKRSSNRELVYPTQKTEVVTQGAINCTQHDIHGFKTDSEAQTLVLCVLLRNASGSGMAILYAQGNVLFQ